MDIVENTKALLELDAKNALVPHGLGGHARELLKGCVSEIESLRNQLAECQKDVSRLDSKSIIIKIRNEFGDDEECMYVDFDLRKAIDQAMSEKG